MFPGHDEIWSAFERDRDAAAFGARWAAFNRASVFPSLALGFIGGHDDPRAASFFDRLEATVTTLRKVRGVSDRACGDRPRLLFAESDGSRCLPSDVGIAAHESIATRGGLRETCRQR